MVAINHAGTSHASLRSADFDPNTTLIGPIGPHKLNHRDASSQDTVTFSGKAGSEKPGFLKSHPVLGRMLCFCFPGIAQAEALYRIDSR